MLQGEDDIVDVDEVAGALRIAGDDDRLALQRACGEGGDGARRALPAHLAGAEDARQAHDDGATAVQAARLLAEALGHRVGIRRRVEAGAYGRRVDERDAALEEVQRRARVGAHRTGGVAARAGRVGHAGEVQDGVATGEQVARGGVAGVGADHAGQVARVRARRAARARDGEHVVASLAQEHGRPPAEEARRAGDDEPHRR